MAQAMACAKSHDDSGQKLNGRRMPFLLFLIIGLFIGAVIVAAVKVVRSPRQGNWFLSATCAIVVYWGATILLLLALPHLGIIPQEVKQNPFGLQAMAADIWVWGVASFVAITVGVKLAPLGPRALWVYSGAVMAFGLWEFLGDSRMAGRPMAVFVPVAAFAGAMGAAWLTRSFPSALLAPKE
jgi:hypothetical protein